MHCNVFIPLVLIMSFFRKEWKSYRENVTIVIEWWSSLFKMLLLLHESCNFSGCSTLMHWLHVKPNSDFPKIRQFFGRFLSFYRQIFCRNFSPKSKRRIGIRQDFGIFFAFFPFRQTFGFWKIGFGQVSADLRIASEYLPDILRSFQKNWGKINLFFSDFGGEFW